MHTLTGDCWKREKPVGRRPPAGKQEESVSKRSHRGPRPESGVSGGLRVTKNQQARKFPGDNGKSPSRETQKKMEQH